MIYIFSIYRSIWIQSKMRANGIRGKHTMRMKMVMVIMDRVYNNVLPVKHNQYIIYVELLFKLFNT